MPYVDANLFPKVLFTEGSAPGDPGSGNQAVFIDSSDHKIKRKDHSGAVTIIEGGGGGGGITETDYGTTTIGGNTEALPTSTKIYCKQITPATNGLVTAVRAAVKGNGSNNLVFAAAIYDDNAGVPGKIIAVAPFSNASGGHFINSTMRFIDFPISYWAASGVAIWLAVLILSPASSAASIAYAASGSDYIIVPPATWFEDGSLAAPSASGNNYSIMCRLLH